MSVHPSVTIEQRKTHLQKRLDLPCRNLIIVLPQSIIRHGLHQNIDRDQENQTMQDRPIVSSVSASIQSLRPRNESRSNEHESEAKERPRQVSCNCRLVSADSSTGIFGELLGDEVFWDGTVGREAGGKGSGEVGVGANAGDIIG